MPWVRLWRGWGQRGWRQRCSSGCIVRLWWVSGPPLWAGASDCALFLRGVLACFIFDFLGGFYLYCGHYIAHLRCRGVVNGRYIVLTQKRSSSGMGSTSQPVQLGSSHTSHSRGAASSTSTMASYTRGLGGIGLPLRLPVRHLQASPFDLSCHQLHSGHWTQLGFWWLGFALTRFCPLLVSFHACARSNALACNC